MMPPARLAVETSRRQLDLSLRSWDRRPPSWTTPVGGRGGDGLS